MLRNVLSAGEHDVLDGELQTLFEEWARRVHAQTVPSEQVRSLRALGYL
jgi:hypothetical protein